MALRAGAEQAAGDGGGFALAGEGCGVAEAKLDGGIDLIVLGFLGQDDDLHAVIEFRTVDSAFDIGGRGVEGLGVGDDDGALVVLEEGVEIGSGGDDGAVGRGVGDVVADGHVGVLEIGFRDADYILRADVFKAVVLEEHETPIALSDGFVEGAGGDGLGVGEAVFEIAEEAGR